MITIPPKHINLIELLKWDYYKSSKYDNFDEKDVFNIMKDKGLLTNELAHTPLYEFILNKYRFLID